MQRFIQPDYRMANFGDTAVVVTDFYEFLDRYARALFKVYPKLISMLDRVKVFDFSRTQWLNPLFCKHESQAYQNELRIAFGALEYNPFLVGIEQEEANSMILNYDPVILQLGDLRDITVEMPIDAFMTGYEYAKETWESFHLIEMKHIIFTFVLEEDFKEFIKFINKFPEGKSQNLDKFENDFNNLHKNIIYWKEIITNQAEKGENVPGDDALYNLYFEKIPNFYKGFQEAIQRSLYTKLLQIIGDNIRSSGTAYKSDIDPACILKLAQRVNILIKILRRRNIAEKKRVLVVIDAFRNPYEATFFKERYSAFYLFAINTTDEERRRRLFAANMQAADIEALDLREYPSLDNSIHDFYKINIEKTVEIADVHIHNITLSGQAMWPVWFGDWLHPEL